MKAERSANFLIYDFAHQLLQLKFIFKNLSNINSRRHGGNKQDEILIEYPNFICPKLKWLGVFIERCESIWFHIEKMKEYTEIEIRNMIQL